jgi:hypothetical protein
MTFSSRNRVAHELGSFVATLGWCMWAMQAECADSLQPADARPCRSDDLLGYVPPAGEVEGHRRFELPSIAYPYARNSRTGGWCWR